MEQQRHSHQQGWQAKRAPAAPCSKSTQQAGGCVSVRSFVLDWQLRLCSDGQATPKGPFLIHMHHIPHKAQHSRCCSGGHAVASATASAP